MQFKCSSCGHKFESDDENYVRCPKCQSDNVAPFKPSNKKLLVIPFAVLVIAVVTYSVLTFLKQPEIVEPVEQTDEEVAVNDISKGVTQDSIFHVDEKKAIPEPVMIQLSVPKYSNGVYSFKATCDYLPDGVKVKYQLKDSFESKLFKESENGVFTGVAPSSEADGSYAVVLVDASNGQKLTSKIITGLIKVKALKEKMSKSQLQDMINKKNKALLNSHPSIVPRPTLYFSNFNSEKDKKRPVILADIFQKFTMNIWESIVITNIGYDENNMVNSVTMNIVYSDF